MSAQISQAALIAKCREPAQAGVLAAADAVFHSGVGGVPGVEPGVLTGRGIGGEAGVAPPSRPR